MLYLLTYDYYGIEWSDKIIRHVLISLLGMVISVTETEILEVYRNVIDNLI